MMKPTQIVVSRDIDEDETSGAWKNDVKFCNLPAIITEMVQAIRVRSIENTNRKSYSTNQMVHLQAPTATKSAQNCVRKSELVEYSALSRPTARMSRYLSIC